MTLLKAIQEKSDIGLKKMIAMKMLQKMGYYADVASNGFEAFNALSSVPYDLVLMDCQMPECDGHEATLKIRSSETQFKDIFFLAMTANAMAGDLEKCLEAGMNGHMSNSISLVKGEIEFWLDK